MPLTTPPSRPLGRARWAVDHAQAFPEEALSVALGVVASNFDPEASAVAHWAAGLASRELGNLTDSRFHLEKAGVLAESSGRDRLRFEISSSQSLTLAYLGLTDEALRLAETAGRHLSGAAAARNQMQRSLILQRMGRLDDALAGYDVALPGLREAGDRLAEARLLTNRGLLHGYAGRLSQGIEDLVEARLIAEALGQPMMRAALAHNLGFLELRRGDLPASFAWFDEAESGYEKAGSPTGHLASLEADRAGALLMGGLIAEAREGYRRAIEELRRESNLVDLAENQLSAARAALVAGEPDDAARLASEAETAFRHQRRTPWAQLASLVKVQARSAGDRISERAARELSRVAAALGGRLARAGLPQEADEARLSAGELALRAGEIDRARRILNAVASREHGTALQRARTCYASALLHAADGNRADAARAVRSGLDILHEYQASLGAAELRARSARHALALVELAVGLALEDDDPHQALVAVESWRSISWLLPHVRPPRDPSLAGVLVEVREIDERLSRAVDTGEARDRLVRRQIELEEEAGRIVRRRPGAGNPIGRFDLAGLHQRLGDRSLLVFFERRGAVGAVLMEAGVARLVQGRPSDLIEQEVSALVFALHRLASGRGSSASLVAAEEAMRHAASVLSDALLSSLSPSAEEVVIVPTGTLHRLPWGALPGLAGRSVSVSPSVGAWARAFTSLRPVRADGKAVVAAGPGLDGALSEVGELSGQYPRGVTITGEKATVANVIHALDGSSVAHISAHGSFRSDNPLFSSLKMFDGPLTVHDLEGLSSPPPIVVLASCDSGVNRVMVGDEILGLSAAFLRLGVSSLIAPVVPVSDAATVRLMTWVHEGLRNGLSPARALSRAVSSVVVERPGDLAAQASFVAFGA